MGEQATLPTTDTPGKPTTRLTGGYYRPAIERQGQSTCTKVRYKQNTATAKPGWELWFEAKPNGAPADWFWFRQDDTVLTVFCGDNSVTLPKHGTLHVNWKVVWTKSGYNNTINEITQGETAVTTPTAPTPAPAAAPTSELATAFPRTDDNLPVEDKPAATPAWGDDNKRRGRFMGYYTDLCDAHAVPKDEREPIRKRVLKAKYGVDSLKGFNQPEADLLKALKAEIEPLYPLEMAGKPAPQPDAPEAQTQQPASTPPQTAKSEQGVSTPTPPTTNAPERPVSPKNGQAKETSVSDKPIDTKDEIRNRYNSKQRGNDYLMVQGRVLIFRLDHPDWSLETDLVGMTDDAAVFKATIRNAEGRVIATGHGRASETSTKHLGGRWIEKAETAALGRALALAGYGTDSTLDDADYLADSPVAA